MIRRSRAVLKKVSRVALGWTKTLWPAFLDAINMRSGSTQPVTSGGNVHARRTVLYLSLLFVFCSIDVIAAHAQGGAIRTPDYTAVVQEIESGAKGDEAAKRLQQEGDDGKSGKNRYRGGSEEDPEANMEKLLEKILYPQGGDVDKWYSPHLRDSKYPPAARGPVAMRRAEAGAASIKRGVFCTRCVNGLGLPKTACPQCQPAMGGCALQEWYDTELSQACCRRDGIGTRPYIYRTTDSNFKFCCVREADKEASTEQIACKYPKGDGWAGLFEYYYPTQIIGWENDRTTTMIASKNEVSQCLQRSSQIMQGKSDWVEKAIKRNLKQVEKLEGGVEVSTKPDGDEESALLQSKIQQDVKDVIPKDQDLRFTDGLQAEGLTLRVAFPTMKNSYRRALALHFCMHPDQLMKIMDPQDDPTQKRYSSMKTDIPIWSNYCPQGVALMTDPDESMKLENIDDTPTKLNVGMRIWNDDPLYCQRINAGKNEHLSSTFGEVLAKSGAGVGGLSAEQTGFTCGDSGKLNGGLVPVEMYRHAAIERRTAIADHALGFLIAGGLYPGEMRDLNGTKSYYKRFEPQRYSEKFGIFRGKQFVGAPAGPVNEMNPPRACDVVRGENFAGPEANRSDRLYISDFTHKDVFTKAIINKPANSNESKEFDNYVQEWAEQSAQNKITHRGLDEKSSNYAAVFRIFATCPKGYTRWRPKNPALNSESVDQICGEEHLGGKHPPIGR